MQAAIMSDVSWSLSLVISCVFHVFASDCHYDTLSWGGGYLKAAENHTHVIVQNPSTTTQRWIQRLSDHAQPVYLGVRHTHVR